MVSKIAVMALVAVVAVPILLGYGLNLDESTITTYAPSGDEINLAPMLGEPSAYYHVPADIYAINTQRGTLGYPYYNQLTNTYTSLILHQNNYTNGALPALLSTSGIENYGFYTIAPNVQLTVVVNGQTIVDTDGYIRMVNGEIRNGSFYLASYHINGTMKQFINPSSISYALIGANQGGDSYVSYSLAGYTANQAAQDGNFVDVAGGFRVLENGKIWNLPSYANKVVLTIDLSEISGFYAINNIRFVPYGNTCFIYYSDSDTSYLLDEIPIYSSDNSVYQLTETDTYYQIDYIGKWPTKIGVAPAYITYGPYDKRLPGEFDKVHLKQDFNNPGWTPTTRIDMALVRSMEHLVIIDKEYDPATYRPDNPITTLSNISQYGDSIIFGGHTFTVSNGKITIEGKSVSLEGREFNSIKEGNVWYNRIGSTIISESATPSTIIFNGTWDISNISTQNQTEKTITETKWVPGQFAWDGVDTNFKMAGLLASLGAFIALAIYGRRSGAKVLPLLLVCGGAAFMFLLMI